MRRRQWMGLAGSFIGLVILFMFWGTVILVTVLLSALLLSSASGLIFDKREDDVTKDIPGD